MSCCFVPGCKTGYNSERKKLKIEGRKVSMFQPPKDPLLFEKWKIAIARSDRELSVHSRVCELHFSPEDVIRYFITNLPDGTVHKLERGNPTLKADAIPCIFLNSSAFFNRNAPKRKRKPYGKKLRKVVIQSTGQPVIEVIEPVIEDEVQVFPNSPACFNRNAPETKRKPSGKKQRKAVIQSTGQPVIEVIEPVIEDEVQVTLLTTIQPSVLLNDFTFKDLIENLDKIKRPSEWWCVFPTVEFIICSKWNSEYVSEKRVIIKEDLEVKIFLRDSEYDMLENWRINCINDVSVLLEKVDKLIFLNAGIPQENLHLF